MPHSSGPPYIKVKNHPLRLPVREAKTPIQCQACSDDPPVPPEVNVDVEACGERFRPRTKNAHFRLTRRSAAQVNIDTRGVRGPRRAHGAIARWAFLLLAPDPSYMANACFMCTSPALNVYVQPCFAQGAPPLRWLRAGPAGGWLAGCLAGWLAGWLAGGWLDGWFGGYRR